MYWEFFINPFPYKSYIFKIAVLIYVLEVFINPKRGCAHQYYRTDQIFGETILGLTGG